MNLSTKKTPDPAQRPSGPIRGEDGDDAGVRIRARRKELGITQQQISEQANVSRQTVISLETGDYAPSVYLAVRIARLLEITVEELWG